MLAILIVEDGAEKAAQILRVLGDVVGADIGTKIAKTVSEAVRELNRSEFDLMILDLNIPKRDGEQAHPGGGVEVLKTLKSDRRLKRPKHIVGLTAFDELLQQFRADFEGDLWSLIKYDENSSEWERRLLNKVLYLVQMNLEEAVGGYEVDLAIITALEAPELQAVLDINGAWKRREVANDDAIYYDGMFARDGKHLSVVAGAIGEMGMPAAAAYCMKMIRNFRPRFVAIVGIAAGVAGECGDVLVADQVWDYGSGKRVADQAGVAKLEPAPTPIPLDSGLKARFNCFAREAGVLAGIESRWRGEGPAGRISQRIGPIASGAAVLSDRRIVEEIRGHNRKLIGVEMEAYGVFCAARHSWHPRPLPIAVKSICDYGDAKKEDRFQRFASYSSAQYLYEFALAFLSRSA